MFSATEAETCSRRMRKISECFWLDLPKCLCHSLRRSKMLTFCLWPQILNSVEIIVITYKTSPWLEPWPWVWRSQCLWCSLRSPSDKWWKDLCSRRSLTSLCLVHKPREMSDLVQYLGPFRHTIRFCSLPTKAVTSELCLKAQENGFWSRGSEEAVFLFFLPAEKSTSICHPLQCRLTALPQVHPKPKNAASFLATDCYLFLSLYESLWLARCLSSSNHSLLGGTKRRKITFSLGIECPIWRERHPPPPYLVEVLLQFMFMQLVFRLKLNSATIKTSHSSLCPELEVLTPALISVEEAEKSNRSVSNLSSHKPMTNWMWSLLLFSRSIGLQQHLLRVQLCLGRNRPYLTLTVLLHKFSGSLVPVFHRHYLPCISLSSYC